MPDGNVGTTHWGARYLWDFDVGVQLFSPRYHEREAGHGDECILCGRRTHDNDGVIVGLGGSAFIHPDDAGLEEDDSGFMGWFPVGADCIKAIPRGFRIPRHG